MFAPPERREIKQVEGELVEIGSPAGNFKHGDLVKNIVTGETFRICGQQRLHNGSPCYYCDSGDGTIARVYGEKVLELVSRTDMKRQQGKATYLEALRELAQQRGYKRGWAERVYQARLAKRYGI